MEHTPQTHINASLGGVRRGGLMWGQVKGLGVVCRRFSKLCTVG